MQKTAVQISSNLSVTEIFSTLVVITFLRSDCWGWLVMDYLIRGKSFESNVTSDTSLCYKITLKLNSPFMGLVKNNVKRARGLI